MDSKFQYPNREIPASELQLGDVVKVGNGPFMTAIVSQIENGLVKLYRPYGRSDDFSYTGGVICYVGIEHFSVMASPATKFFVYERKTLK